MPDDDKAKSAKGKRPEKKEYVPPTPVEPTVEHLADRGGHGRTRETHPSYGMIRVGRRTGGGHALFGSPILCDAVISVEIYRGEVIRELNENWYMNDAELIEVHMSPAQFAEMITNPNIGCGIPCTIRHINREEVPECPQKHERRTIEDEFEARMKEFDRETRKDLADAEVLLADKSKKTLTNADRETLRSAFSRVHRFLTDGVPFVQSQFNRATDKTVDAAKAEYAAALQMIAHAMGVQQINAALSGAEFAAAQPKSLGMEKRENTADGDDATATDGEFRKV